MAATRSRDLLIFLLAASLAAYVKASPAHEVLQTAFAAAGGAGEGGRQLGWMRSACRGTIAGCLGDGEEFDLSSESTRRILATSNYISYASLNRDTIPCSRPGASYYNCRPGASANPYTRGCSAITQCRS